MRHIGVLVPTRGRAKKCLTMLDSLFTNANYPDQVTVYLGIDVDDPEAIWLRCAAKDHPGVVMPILPIDSTTVSQIWTDLASQAVAEGCDLLLMGNDDQTYTTQCWDEAFRHAFDLWDDPIGGVVFANDGINGETHAAFPCVSKGWFETLGYFAPLVGMRFFRNDTWIFDLGKRLNRIHYLADVRIDHDHHTVEGGVKDETTARHRSDAGYTSGHDKALWDRTEQVRAKDAERLRDAIKTGAGIA